LDEQLQAVVVLSDAEAAPVTVHLLLLLLLVLLLLSLLLLLQNLWIFKFSFPEILEKNSHQKWNKSEKG
jgi:hypothetical protein